MFLQKCNIKSILNLFQQNESIIKSGRYASYFILFISNLNSYAYSIICNYSSTEINSTIAETLSFGSEKSSSTDPSLCSMTSTKHYAASRYLSCDLCSLPSARLSFIQRILYGKNSSSFGD